ncbi:hypothetical protein H4W34_002016 [Actinomadura algeriensis]|uniref:Uncharacterized protein n=1 Tax=Actinomadura algeriensis TaxID=1679523 RepID=A0ABR9JNU9_9ACTN|nr:hypothetical protein [Actinomadura algeriensis]
MRPWKIAASVAGLVFFALLVKEYPAMKRYIKMERM